MSIAFAAMLSNAATVTWGVTGVTASPANAADVGMVAYLMNGSSYTAFSALLGGEFTKDDLASVVTANKLYDGATQAVAGRFGSTINVSEVDGDYKAGDTVNAYLVLFDSKALATSEYFAYTETQSATVGAAGAPITLSWGAFDTATGATGGWQAVPEPTSGLLMLVGLAGLALRRKRA